MLEAEKKEYQKLTTFQKDVVDALNELGFEWRYFHVYEKKGWGTISVTAYSKWSSVLKTVHAQGKQQKMYEIQRAIGL